MEAAEVVSEDLAPAERLTPQQRSVLLAYARTGTIREAAADLGITPQTAKNHLSQGYRRLGVTSGPQAIFVVFGGPDVAMSTPPADQRSLEHDVTVLRTRVRVLERQLRQQPRGSRIVAPLEVPAMVDGHITLQQLREASSRYDADMDRTTDMLMTAREWVELLSYHVRSVSPLAQAAAG